jgi:hypothetical protein
MKTAEQVRARTRQAAGDHGLTVQYQYARTDPRKYLLKKDSGGVEQAPRRHKVSPKWRGLQKEAEKAIVIKTVICRDE